MHSSRPNCLEYNLKIEHSNESCSDVMSLFNSKRVFIWVIMSFRLASMSYSQGYCVRAPCCFHEREACILFSIWFKPASYRALMLFQSMDESPLYQWRCVDVFLRIWCQVHYNRRVFRSLCCLLSICPRASNFYFFPNLAWERKKAFTTPLHPFTLFHLLVAHSFGSPTPLKLAKAFKIGLLWFSE